MEATLFKSMIFEIKNYSFDLVNLPLEKFIEQANRMAHKNKLSEYDEEEIKTLIMLASQLLSIKTQLIVSGIMKND